MFVLFLSYFCNIMKNGYDIACTQYKYNQIFKVNPATGTWLVVVLCYILMFLFIRDFCVKIRSLIISVKSFYCFSKIDNIQTWTYSDDICNCCKLSFAFLYYQVAVLLMHSQHILSIM